jgi:hypothetical protein
MSTVKQIRQRRDHRGRDADAAGREGNDRHRQIRAAENRSLVLAVGEHSDVEFLKTLAGIKIGRGDVVEVDAHMRPGTRACLPAAT